MSVVVHGRRRKAFFLESWKLGLLVAGGAALVSVSLLLAGAPPGHTLWDLVKGGLGNELALTGTLREVTPLLISGAAVFLALKAGLFNIGVEGQFTVGALVCSLVALAIPGWIGMALAVVAGALAGAIWALPAAAIRAYRGGHEVITTIMLNSVAAYLATALVAGPFKDPKQETPTTAILSSASTLPDLVQHGNLEVNSGLLLGILLTFALWWWLGRYVSGYELQAVGENPAAARYAGVSRSTVIMRAMTWSGSIGGLAGAVQVLAFEHRFYPGISSGYGFDALGVALLGGGSPLGLFPAAGLFGLLDKGGTSIQVVDQVPKGITTMILGILIVLAAAVRYRKIGAGVD